MAFKSVTLLILVVSVCVTGVPLSDFFPFGPETGDKSLPPSNDATASLTLKQTYPLYGQRRKQLAVYTDGRLELRENEYSRQYAAIYPFSADVDTRAKGEVFYRETTDLALLKQAVALIHPVFPEIRESIPSSLFIATWFYVGYFDSHGDKTNTFQCILATNGTVSYTAFLYGDGLIQWSQGDSGEMAAVGFVSDKSDPFFIPESHTIDVLRMDAFGNTDIPGLWVFRVDGKAIGTPLPSTTTVTRSKREFFESGDVPTVTPDPGEIYVSFARPRYTVDEAAGSLPITITLDYGGITTGEIQVFTVDKTAAAGSDYQALSSIIGLDTATGGELILELIIFDDLVFEKFDEKFQVIIEALSGNIILGRCVMHVCIVDNDLPIEGHDFIPFLDFVNPTHLPPSDDGFSAPIFIPIGFPFGNSVQDFAYVGVNGIISFGSGWPYFSPTPFPTSFFPTRNSYVVAPFWSDNDIRLEGDVFYEVHERDSDASIQLLDTVSHFIVWWAGYDFSGCWMLVAQWDNVHPYPHGFFPFLDPATQALVSQVNTYQAIVITDGIYSFAVFTYRCGLLQWSGLSNHATVGFNALGSFYFNYPLSGNPLIVPELACACYPRLPWSNLHYQLAFSVSSEQQERAQCYKKYVNDIELYGSTSFIQFAAFFVPPCPCSLFQACLDWRYILTFFFQADSVVCFVPIFPSFVPFLGFGPTSKCCYHVPFLPFFGPCNFFTSPFSFLLTSGPFGSSMLRWHPFFFPVQFLQEDFWFRITCCQTDGAACSLYYLRRPRNSCFGYTPPWRCWIGGDPHFTTLDSRQYTFNGLGEYTLLDFTIDGEPFTVQGRTVLVTNSTATQFSAFAFGQDGTNVTSVVEVRRENDDYDVLFNGESVTTNVTAVNDSFTTLDISISRTDVDTIVTTFPSGPTIQVRVDGGIPNIVVTLSQQLRNSTRGLLGNFNDDQTDDFLFRDGMRVLANNASDSMIHEFGQSWQITDAESLFTYPPGQSVDDFSDPNHEPDFLDDVMENADPSVVEMCNNDEQCIYDAVQTGSVEVGMATLQGDESNQQQFTTSINNPPVMQGADRFRVNIGEESLYVFNVTDEDENITVSVLGDLPMNSFLEQDDPSTYTFHWNLMQIENTTVTFFAIDTVNATSTLAPVVEMCACINGGNCTLDGIIDPDNSPVVMNCDCPGAWSGDLCEFDTDGCLEVMCFPGVECEDVPAPGVGASCGECPVGYTGNGSKCVDIDECTAGTHNCSDNCTNTDGSFVCSCLSGFELEDSTNCVDIDECAVVNDCQQVCINTFGSFSCGCDDGFELNPDGITCNATTPCDPPTLSCEEGCAVVNGSEECFCTTPGFELDADGLTCVDIDECLQSPCDQNCTNFDESFSCSCPDPGFVLNPDGRTCDDIDECMEAVVAGDTLCIEGQMCINTFGSFDCVCPAGTEFVNGSCQVVTIGFVETVYSVNEDAGSVSVCISATGGQLTTSVVTVTTVQVTATGGSDYVDINAEKVEFPILPATQCVDICIVNDRLIEGIEELRVMLTSAFMDSNIVLTPPTTTVVITDTSAVTIGFTQPTYSVSEDDGYVEVCVSANGADFARTVMVTLSTEDGTAIAGSDYEEVSNRVLVFVTSTTMCVQILVNDDTIVEYQEHFTVALSSNDMAVDFDGSSTTVTITDTSIVSIGFQQMSYSVREDETMATVCFDVIGQLDSTYNISLTTTTIAITATAPGDYGAISLTDERSYMGQGCRNITINNDGVLEPSEEVFGVLLSSTDTAVNLTAPFTSVTIIDTSSVQLSFDTSSYTVDEDAGVISVCVQLSGQLAVGRVLIATLSTTPGSAVAPDDYIPLSYHLLEFTNDTSYICVDVYIVDDEVLDAAVEESFGLVLNSSDAAFGGSETTVDTAEVIIVDTTVAEVYFQQFDYTVYEGAGSVTVCVNTNELRRRLRDFIVCIIDIIFGFKEIVVFPPTTCEVCVDINITSGTYRLPLQLDSTDPAVVFDVNSSSTVFVVDSFNVTFQQDMQTVLESVGVLDVCVTVSGIDNPNFPGIEVALHTEDGSALEGEDFSANFTSMNISSNTDLCISVLITSDEVLEDLEEVFNVVLAVSFMKDDGAPVYASIPSPDSEIVIEDDDAVYVAFGRTEYEIPESAGSSELASYVCVDITGQFAVDVIVTVSTESLTATADVDFPNKTNEIVFSPGGNTRECTCIPIFDDTILEDDETFTLLLSTTNPAVNITEEDATVTIIDDDAFVVTVGFEQTDYMVMEAGGTISVCVVLTGEIEVNVAVGLFTVDGTAFAGMDYTAVTTSLMFTPATANGSMCVDIDIIDDDLEDPELHDFLVKLNTSDPITLSPQEATVTIMDDEEVIVLFTQQTYSVNEGGTSQVCLSLNQAPHESITVNVSTLSDGLASEGSDYVGFTQGITFDPPATNVCVEVEAISDSRLEGTESFTVMMSSDDSVIILPTMSTATVDIIDQTIVTVDFLESGYEIDEDDSTGELQVCARLLPPSVSLDNGQTVRFTIFTRPGSGLGAATEATQPDTPDYLQSIKSAELTSPSIGCMDIPIYNDDEIEGTEFFFVQLSSVDAVVDGTGSVEVCIQDDDIFVPDLPQPELTFTSNTPMVSADGDKFQVALEFDKNEGVKFVTCQFLPPQRTEVDCTDGSHVFTDINPRVVAYRVVMTAYGFDKGTPVVEQERRVYVTDTRCILNLINEGFTVTGDTATVEWQEVGPMADTICRLNGAVINSPPCESPFVLSGLQSGDELVVRPVDPDPPVCERRIGLSFTIP